MGWAGLVKVEQGPLRLTRTRFGSASLGGAKIDLAKAGWPRLAGHGWLAMAGWPWLAGHGWLAMAGWPWLADQGWDIPIQVG